MPRSELGYDADYKNAGVTVDHRRASLRTEGVQSPYLHQTTYKLNKEDLKKMYGFEVTYISYETAELKTKLIEVEIPQLDPEDLDEPIERYIYKTAIGRAYDNIPEGWGFYSLKELYS